MASPEKRSYAFWNAISATPADFILGDGTYGLTVRADTWGTAQLQRVFHNGVTVNLGFPVQADGYQSFSMLPSGNYRLVLAGTTNMTGAIERIAQQVV